MIQRATGFLTSLDEQQIKQWLRFNRSALTGTVVAGFLCAAAAVAFLWVAALDATAFIPVLIFAPLAAFFWGKAGLLVIRNRQTSQAYTRAQKVYIRGRLAAAAVNGRDLCYHIEDQALITSVVPGADKRYFDALMRSLTGFDVLAGTMVELQLLELTAGRYLLLHITYAGTGAQTTTGTIAPGDTAKADREISGFLNAMRAIVVILGMVMAGILIFSSDSGYLVWPFLLMTLFMLFLVLRHSISDRLCRSKLVITGVVTEVLTVKTRLYKNGPLTSLYWYRLGAELVCGHPLNPVFKPGDSVTVSFQCSSAGKIFRLIDISSEAIPPADKGK